MEKPKIKILLAEDNPGGFPFWERLLEDVRGSDIEFIHLKQLSDIDKHIGAEVPDVVLLDLTLPQGGGLEIFRSIVALFPSLPILVVTAADDQKLAVQTALEGAQDCLVKSDLNGFLLSRSMRYAIGRQKHLQQLKAFSAIDELTGLCNRRGFLTLADQQIKMSGRTGQSLLLVLVDVDGLKAINDELGHHQGDLAIMETAHVLREAFRETDILGRLGGDEFVALLTQTDGVNEESLTKRFLETLAEHNSYPKRSFRLSVSFGFSSLDPLMPCSLEALLQKADAAMYGQKRSSKVPA